MTDELDRQIEEMEIAWQKYHKDHRNNPCPNMLELTKLKIRRNELRRKDARVP